MLKLSDSFLHEVGLDGLDEDEKKPFLRHIYQELESRIGLKLSDSMSDQQLAEFDRILDKDQSTISNWLSTNSIDYTKDNLYKMIQKKSGLDFDSTELLAEYCATKWLEVTRPDYKQVVTATLEEIQAEVIQNRDAILGQ